MKRKFLVEFSVDCDETPAELVEAIKEGIELVIGYTAAVHWIQYETPPLRNS